MSKKDPTWRARVRRYVERGRYALMVQLGGVCVRCGADDQLQFDHVNGTPIVLERTSQHRRLSHYRELAARGEIQLLCASCNRKKGRPHAGGRG